MSTEIKHASLRTRLTKEVAVFSVFLFLGLVILPLLIYTVGQSVFGEYGGTDYGGFLNSLSGKVRSGDLVAIFLVFSPYIGWQCLRLAIYAWRAVNSESPAP